MGLGGSKFSFEDQLRDDKSRQSTQLSGAAEEKDATVPRHHNGYPEMLDRPFKDEGDFRTVWSLFERGVNKFGDNPLLGTRKYESKESEEEKGQQKYVRDAKGLVRRGDYVWESYSEVHAQAKAFGDGLAKLGVNKGDNVGIFAINRAEWVIAAMGCYSRGIRVVSLYPTLGADAVEYISNHSDLEVLIFEKGNLKALTDILPNVPKLKTLIQFDVNEKYNNVEETLADAPDGVELKGFSDVLASGDGSAEFEAPGPEDLCMIMYTSGTTGKPKGAMISHGNLLASAGAVPIVFPFKDSDVHISYLPLAHIFETAVQLALIGGGGRIGFFQGVISMLADDLGALRPTIMAGVPRVFQKMYGNLMGKVGKAGFVKRMGFNYAYSDAKNRSRVGRPRSEKWDKKIFTPIRQKLGLDRCRLIITGAAPCPPYLMDFLRACIGATVLQGYGMTETAASLTVTQVGDLTIGHVPK